MSKFLKFIVHLVIFCTIISVLALTIPQFFGVYTAINDGTYEDTNLPMGSVTYAKEASLESLTVETPFLYRIRGMYIGIMFRISMWRKRPVPL